MRKRMLSLWGPPAQWLQVKLSLATIKALVYVL
jgi:hypothetical protein